MFQIYSDLWRWAEQIGRTGATKGVRAIYVNERGCSTSSFTPDNEDHHPEIRIRNPDRAHDDPTARPLSDGRVPMKLVALSHEAGHATSWDADAAAWAEYQAAVTHRDNVRTQVWLAQFGASDDVSARATVDAVVAALTARERNVVWREENRAWDIGGELLRERGFDEWTAFESRRAESLRSYDVSLGRVPIEPGDVLVFE